MKWTDEQWNWKSCLKKKCSAPSVLAWGAVISVQFRISLYAVPDMVCVQEWWQDTVKWLSWISYANTWSSKSWHWLKERILVKVRERHSDSKKKKNCVQHWILDVMTCSAWHMYLNLISIDEHGYMTCLRMVLRS